MVEFVVVDGLYEARLVADAALMGRGRTMTEAFDRLLSLMQFAFLERLVEVAAEKGREDSP